MTTYKQRLEERFGTTRLNAPITLRELFSFAEALDEYAQEPRVKIQGTNPIANMVEAWAEPFGDDAAAQNDAISSSEAQWRITLAQKNDRIAELERELSETARHRDYLDVNITQSISTLTKALEAANVEGFTVGDDPTLIEVVTPTELAIREFGILNRELQTINATLKPLNLPGPSVSQAVKQLAERHNNFETMLKEQYVEKWRLIEAERQGRECFKILEEFGDGVCHVVEKAGGPTHHKVYGWTGKDESNRAQMRASMRWLQDQLATKSDENKPVAPTTFDFAPSNKVQKKTEQSVEPLRFSGELVERLYGAFRDGEGGIRDGIHAVIAELARMPCEFPGFDDLLPLCKTRHAPSHCGGALCFACRQVSPQKTPRSHG